MRVANTLFATRPNHQPPRRPRGPHIEQPSFLALIFALGTHAPGADQRHHHELRAFAPSIEIWVLPKPACA